MLPNKNDPRPDIRTSTASTSLKTPPKAPYIAAIGQLSQKVSGLEVDYDNFGNVRNITAGPGGNLLLAAGRGTPGTLANRVLKQKQIANALGLSSVNLTRGFVTQTPTGFRVEYRQVHHLEDVRRPLPVRGGFVHVHLSADGRVFSITSTLRRGRKPRTLGKIITPQEAIAAAQKALGAKTCERARCTLVLSSHDDRLDPVYEVVLSACCPEKQVMQYLVKARSASVVHQESKLHYGRKGEGTRVRCFLRIPNPNVSIDKQVQDYLLASLPNPRVLKNQRFVPVVLKGDQWVEVQAKADGTFNYKPGEPEFSAVVFFVAVNSQFELLESWGMRKQDRPIKCFMDDPSVSDNAYFDGESYQVHMGVGSGVNNGGLTKWIAFDLGVEWHENGHHMVSLQTPGHDLPGSEGAGAHEASGDWQDLLMDFWFRLKFGQQLGHTLTQEDVLSDPRIIGKYALPPNGIRIQKNIKRTPDDKTGEPHDDGLIIGGALADLLVAMATQRNTKLEDGLAANGRLYLAALALVPAHKVMWKDILRCLKTADQQLFQGAYWGLIEKSFGNHGITLSGPVTDPDSRPRKPRKPRHPRNPRRPRKPGKGKKRLARVLV